MNKIKDIEYAFFSQLAYLNWSKLDDKSLNINAFYINKEFMNFLADKDNIWNKIKTPFYDNKENLEKVENGILMYHEEDKRLFGVFGTEKNKNNSELMNPLYNFDGWQFIYSADKTKLYKDKYNLDNVEDDGFFACAFMKNDNEIIIAYRGTETTYKDFLTDLEIGFYNNSHLQLVNAYIFLKYIKSLYPNITDENIHLTGHSLGGCLAQYAFISSGKKHKTITWNALGVGKYRDAFKINTLKDNENISNYLKNLWNHLHITETSQKIVNEFITEDENIILKTEEEDRKKLYEIINGMIQKNPFIETNLNSKIESISLDIYLFFINVLEIRKTINKDSENIINYYNSLDWTADLQTREGKCIDVLTGNETLKEDVDDSKLRVILSTLSKGGTRYHGVNDFLIYMNTNGMIQAGHFNLTFTKNSIKTVYENILKTDKRRMKESKKLDFLKEGTTNKTEKEKPFLNFHTTCTKKPLFGIKQSEIEIAKIKYTLPTANALSSDVAPYIPYREFEENERANGNDEVGVFIIGQVANVTLGGIKGGDTIQLIKVGEPIQKQSLAEQITEIKNKKEIDAGTCIGWGTKGGSTEYDVIKYSDGTIVRQPRYC